jgi:ABC-type oligopeptide transport system substrate-binding subunit
MGQSRSPFSFSVEALWRISLLPVFRDLPLKRTALLAAVVGALLLCSACSKSKPATELQPTATTPVPAATLTPIVATRLVEQPVDKTVVITATPVPTPAYVSRTTLPAGTLAYPLANAPQTFDPQAADDDASRLVVAQLYEGLFGLDQAGTAQPDAASGYQASDDGKTYTVTLRSGLQWSDGQPVTAQQYVDGFCRALDPANGNDLAKEAAGAAGIRRAAAYAGGMSGDCAEVGVRATDTQHIRIELEHPTWDLAQLLAYPAWLPAPRSATNGDSSTASALPDPGSFVGNGPYLPAAWEPGTRLTLAKNEHYWDAAHVSIPEIDLAVIADTASELARYEQGSLHVAGFTASELPRITAQAAFSEELHSLVKPGISYLGLNTRSGPTADANFRRAIASAIDRRALIRDGLRQPWHTPADGLIPPGVPGYQAQDKVAYPYDPAATQKFLAQAGYGPDNPPPAVDLWTSREGNNPALMQAVSTMLEKAGIPTRLVTSSWDVYQAALAACTGSERPAGCGYGLYWAGWMLQSANPADLLSGVLAPQSSLQYTGWQSGDYEGLLARAADESDAAKRGELYRAAEKVLLQDSVAVIPLIYYDQLELIKQGVGFAYPPFGPPEFKRWTLP